MLPVIFLPFWDTRKVGQIKNLIDRRAYNSVFEVKPTKWQLKETVQFCFTPVIASLKQKKAAAVCFEIGNRKILSVK